MLRQPHASFLIEGALQIAQRFIRLPLVASVKLEEFAVGRDDRGAQAVCELAGVWEISETEKLRDLFDLLRASGRELPIDRKSTRLNSSHLVISYAVFCLKKKIRSLYHLSQR